MTNATSSLAIADQQLEDVRERIRLLQQDVRANVDILETTKVNNEEEIKTLQEENKELKSNLTMMHKTFGSSRKKDDNELVLMRKEVRVRRAEYDALKVASRKRQAELERLQDEARACELEAQKPNQEDSSLARQIRSLENRLDKAMIKYNEAQSIKGTYEQIVKRLKDERISFDNQLTALERTVQAKERDYEELMLLSADASHARDVALQELHVARCAYEENRICREGELRERHQVIKVRRQMMERQKMREEKQKELLEREYSGDETERGDGVISDTNLLSRLSGNGTKWRRERASCIIAGKSGDQVQEEEEIKIDMYESAFRKIREATGVSDVNEVIKKVMGQESTTEHLVSLTKENQEKIEILTKERNLLKKQREDIRHDISGSPQRRKVIDDKEKQLKESIKELDRLKERHDRYVSNLFSTKAGVNHLLSKLEPICNDLNVDKEDLSKSSLTDVLWEVGDTLVEVLARIREREITMEISGTLAATTIGSMGTKPGTSEGDENKIEDEEGLLEENRPFNQRILLPSAKDDLYENNESFDDAYGNLDEEELSRERVKKASTSLVHQMEREMKKRERMSRNLS